MYKTIQMYVEETNKTIQFIIKTEGNLEIHIPADPRNRHYQEYLAWLAEGNEPEPADEQ